ncbi:transposase [Streptomyces sp. NPDC054804]
MVDHFHVVRLANKRLSLVRRRTTAELRGRRGRAPDPEWKARRRLLRTREDLTDESSPRCEIRCWTRGRSDGFC